MKTFKTVNDFEISFDDVTYINRRDGKDMVCTRKTAFIGKAMYEVSPEVASQIRAMFAVETDAYMDSLEGEEPTPEVIRMQNLVAFVESHGNKVIGYTDTTITAETEIRDAAGNWATEQETFPATVKGARDWLGY